VLHSSPTQSMQNGCIVKIIQLKNTVFAFGSMDKSIRSVLVHFERRGCDTKLCGLTLVWTHVVAGCPWSDKPIALFISLSLSLCVYGNMIFLLWCLTSSVGYFFISLGLYFGSMCLYSTFEETTFIWAVLWSVFFSSWSG